MFVGHNVHALNTHRFIKCSPMRVFIIICLYDNYCSIVFQFPFYLLEFEVLGDAEATTFFNLGSGSATFGGIATRPVQLTTSMASDLISTYYVSPSSHSYLL